MELKTGVTFHNRFDIEVRDKDTNELKYQGHAENIILDRMYTRLCNFDSYFTNIVFGSGTGDLSPSRTTLFNRVGYKSATTEEIVKGFPVSKWTRSITLAPEEYVGVELTEVGISNHDTYINTHALIKDAEGNPLSIVKTDIDVVIIYATVFIELANKSENVYWSNLPNNNILLNYLCGSSFSDPNIVVGNSAVNCPNYIASIVGSNTSTRVSNPAAKVATFSTRFGVDSGNSQFNAIREIGLVNLLRAKLPEDDVFTSYNLKDIPLGIGDGIENAFEIPNEDINNLIVKIDGVQVSNYSYEPGLLSNVIRNLTQIADIESITTDLKGLDGSSGYVSPYSTEVSIFKPNISFEGLTLTVSGSRGIPYRASIRIYTLNEGSEDWNEVFYFSPAGGEGTRTQKYTFTETPELIRIVITREAGTIKVVVDPIEADNKIIFNTPPPEGAVITADYTVPYIPKTKDYVLDVSVEIQFGEGTII